jgi:hypothetical protein
LEEQAEALAQLRAYLCPLPEIPIQGEGQLNTMEEWGVPKDSLAALRKQVIPQLANSNVDAARGALHAVFEEHDSWSDYIDDYNAEMFKVGLLLAACIVISLVAAIYLVSSRHVVWGLLAAGACGAFVSVIAKLPTLQISGDSAPYKRGILRRVCTGLVASVIGIGFLVSGILTISFPQSVSVPGMVAACANPATDGPSGTGPALPSSDLPSTKPIESGECKTAHVLILVAIVMLFGLSDRALTSFEDRVFPAKPQP